MRNFKNLLAAVALTCVFFSGALAQEGQDYFLGEWNVLIKGTPNGDADVRMRFVMDDTTLKGFLWTLKAEVKVRCLVSNL